MKKIITFLCAILFCGTAFSETINWYVDDNVYSTTTCESGGDVVLPVAPTKPGYTFVGWEHYSPVEFLQSTGTQYIDTGYIPQIGTKMEIRVQILTESGGPQDYAGLSSTQGRLTFFSPLTSVGTNLYYYFDGYVSSGRCYANNIMNASIDVSALSATIVQNNETKNSSQTFTRQGVFQPTYSIYLFAGHYDAGAGEFATTKMYYAKIWEWGELIHNYIPVIDINGTPCMYDTVTSEYLYNSGTGDFVAGPVISGE